MFAKFINEFVSPDSILRRMFKSKSKQSLEQVAAEMDPNTVTMETMKDDRVINAVNILTGSAKCICGVHRSDDEIEKERAYAGDDEGGGGGEEEAEGEGEGEGEEGEEGEGEEGEGEEGEEGEGEGEGEEEGEEGEEGEGEEKEEEESSGVV